VSAARPVRPWIVHALLALAVLFVYAPVRHFPFVVYDDKAYVSENPAVLGGLSGEGVAWAFTHSAQGNYVPLAWLSHMLDVELFGLDAGAHHAVNVLLHLASTLLLFEVLRRASGGLWPSAFAAAVFGVHPTHVESVAWVSERRDVLSGLFFVLSLGAYASWTRAGGVLRYAALVVCFTLGLLAKPMLVTLPCLLLLLDLWPLRRTGRGVARLVLEKVPLLLPAAAVAALALSTQQQAMPSLVQLPLGARLAGASVAYAAYLRDMLWPRHLAVFHPLDLDVPPGRALAAALLVAALSAGALLAWRRRPWLTVGWLWFVGMLVPVIGLVQVGSQSMADRYLYLPGIGLAVALAWGGAELAAARPRARRALAGVALLGLAACLLLARAQVHTWRDSVALFEHARALTGGNAVVELNLGEAYEDAGDAERALAHYERALHWQPGARGAHTRIGAILARRGEIERASRHLLLALRLDPADAQAHVELGTLLLRTGQLEAAQASLERALELEPGNAAARYRLAELRALAGEEQAAAALFAEALAARPPARDAPLADKNPAVLVALAAGCAEAGRPEAAERWAARALTLARLAGQRELVTRLEADLARYRAAPR
jgi:tetratricopeptide (TPR) repeat protein